MKIFILKPSSLGDVVQALPVLRLLKLHRPEAEIFWWLDAALVPLLEGDPGLAGIIPFDRQRWGYVFDRLAAAASFTYQNTPVCFFGHTHVPLAFVRDSVVRGGTYSKFKVEPGRKYFVNVGSVGQPRDGNPKASYAIYDMDEASVELRRLDYDIEKTQAKIRAAGLPERLAERLAYGK